MAEGDASKTFADVHPKGVRLGNATTTLMDCMDKQGQALTFDEVTLEDKPSDVHPNDVNLRTFVTRNISLKGCGILSAAMDTVTERDLALALAKMGGMGILHRNLSAEEQCSMVSWVRKKIHYGGMIEQPVSFREDQRFSDMEGHIDRKRYTFTSFPIVNDKGVLVGLMTRDEMDFAEAKNPLIKDIMKQMNTIVTAPGGTTTEEAYNIMREKRVKKLPIISEDGVLQGLYVWNDVRRDEQKRSNFSLDNDGHFLVGAAIGLGESDMERVNMLVNSGCKVLVIDTSHGACSPAKQQIERIRKAHGNNVDIIVGNIASYDSAAYLLKGEFRPDSLKVGIGPGSICTTRQVTGHGVPQLTAIYQVWKAVQDYGDVNGYYVPIIADGGIRTSGDIVKCLAGGASAVMLGSVFASCEESPGETVLKGGKAFKTIRGMGSRSAMEARSGSRGRYHRQGQDHAADNLTKAQVLILKDNFHLFQLFWDYFILVIA
mmetsp:Transcript_26735/g.41684  ORF Transcript_26735/g.41684 Transcript_26735/m.41684 type:complete len:488 (-) Transcript_26735:401-1864(-)